MAKWLDKYDAPQAQNGIEGTMGGLTDVGFNYNGAWGGTMQMGGVLPGAVGFTYARTQSPAPANGPYAKKTKASAQDGKKLSYGQWKKQYNLKETPDYNLKRAWELGYTPDKTGHLPTVDNQTGQFLKAKGHPTLQLELDWYNSPEAADFRSKNAIDSSGKFFKYVPKGQNGQEMKYYQEGLDFKPKTISQNGSAITTDINDYRRWQDSVRNYIRGQKDLATARTNVKKNIDSFSLMSGSGLVGAFSNLIQGDFQGKRRFLPEYKEESLPRQYWGPEEKYPQVPKDIVVVGDPTFDTSRKIKGLTQALWDDKNLKETNLTPYGDVVEIYHPPVRKSLKYQPPVKKQPPAKKQQTSRTIGPFPLPESKKLAKPIPIPREAIDLGYELPVPGAPRLIETSKFENKPTKFSFTYPTGKYNEQKTMYFPSKAALKSFVGSIRDASYQEGADYASATGTLQDGGDIPVDSMGYWNPENVGGPVIIPSNVITMEGVDQPLIGISDTGDVQYMEPGEDYEFDGEYVTEYPVAQKGKRVPITVSDINDPRLRAYQDSLSAYNAAKRAWEARAKSLPLPDLLGGDLPYETISESIFNKKLTEAEKEKQYSPKTFKDYKYYKNNPYWKVTQPALDMMNRAVRSAKVFPEKNIGVAGVEDLGQDLRYLPFYKKPVQPVVYKKPEPKQEVVKKPEPVVEKKAPLTDYFQGTPIYAPTPYHGSGAGAFVGYRTPQGDTVFVKPEDYERMGVPKYGREFIESKTKKMKNGGVSVNNADAQPLKKLDQLLNFTNYNKPTKGGWLDKYN